MIYLILPAFVLAQPTDLDHSSTHQLAADASEAVHELSGEVKSERAANANLNAWWAAEKVKVQGLQSDIEVAESDQGGLQEANAGLEGDIDSLKGILEELHNQFDNFQNEAANMNAERDEAISGLNNFIDELHAGHAVRMEDKNMVLSTVRGEVAGANEKSEGIARDTNELGERTQDTYQHLSGMQSEVEMFSREIDGLNQQFEEMNNQFDEQINSLDSTADSISRDNADLEANAAHAAGTIDQLKSAIKQIHAELDSTPQEMSARISSAFSGFWNSFTGQAEIEEPVTAAIEEPMVAYNLG